MIPLKQLARALVAPVAILSLATVLAGCSQAGPKQQTVVAATDSPSSASPTVRNREAPADGPTWSTADPNADGLARFCSATKSIIDLSDAAKSSSTAELTAAYDHVVAEMKGSEAPADVASEWAEVVDMYTAIDDSLHGKGDLSKLAGLEERLTDEEFQAGMTRIGIAYARDC